MVTNRKGKLEVHFPSFKHGLEVIDGSYSANFARKEGFQTIRQNPFPRQPQWEEGLRICILIVDAMVIGKGFATDR